MDSFVRVPPDSTGKKLRTREATVGSDVVQTQVMHVADPNDPNSILAIDNHGAAAVSFAEGQPTLSGFGSLNVSSKRVLGVYESSAGSYDDLFTITTAAGGTSVYDDTGHGVLLTASSAAGSSVVRTTNRYHYYLPGSSNLFLGTFACGDTGKAGNLRRWGAFDDNDGVFFELYETHLKFVIRSSTTGAVTNNKIDRADWALDKLDGSGLSGLNLDITKINIWWADYQWLGSGRVRFGVFDKDGSRITCHIIENAGSLPLPYMRTGTLPLRTENTNFSATGSSSQLRESCMAMYTEGSLEDYTFWRRADIDSVGKVVGATPTNVVSVRSAVLVPGLNHYNSIVAYPETLNVYTDQPVRIDLYQDVTATGGTWDPCDSSLETNTTNTLSDLIKPFKTWFFAPGAHTMDLSQYFEVNDEGIMLNADSTQAVWAFVGTRLGTTNASVTMNVGYRELW